MRIAMLGPFGLSPKGTMRARALPLARELAARGHAVTVIMPPWHTPDEPPRTWDDAGVTIQYVALGPRIPGLSHLAITWRMVHAALAWKPDIIHCSKPKAYSGLVGWALWHMSRLGLFKTRLLIDEDDWEGPGGWNEIEGYSWAMQRSFAWQERWGLRHAHGVTVASRACETLTWAMGVPADRVTYLPNGAAPQAAPEPKKVAALRLSLGLGQRPVILLYTRFFEFDVARPLEVLARVLESVPDAMLLVVGKALHAKDDARFDALTGEMGLKDAVVRAGWVEPEDLPAHLALGDVALHLLDDTLVNRTKCSAKLVEQMNLGLPIVADAVGENRAFLGEGDSGILVPPGDVGAMAKAVVTLLGNESARQAITVAAEHRAATRYAWSSLADTLIEVYSSLTSDS